MDKVNKPSTTLASIESKSNLLSIENLFTNESSSVLPSIVNVSEGDYFELYAFAQDAGTIEASKYTFLEIEVLEGSLLNSTVGSAISESALANVGIASAGGLTGANTNINTVSSNVDSAVHGITGANTNINTVSSNVDSAVHGITGANANITANKTISDTFGTYANTTFATDTDLNTVSSNAATNTTNINTVQGNAAAFASYANSTFSTGSGADPVESNLTAFGTYANSTFATDTNLNIVQGNLASFGSYANSTFASGNIGLVQGNLDAYSTYANSNFLTTAAANVGASNYPVDATTNAFTMTQSVSNVNNVLVFMDGLVQSPDTYVVSGTTLTISNSSPLPAGVNVDVRYLQFVFPGEIDGGDI